MKCSFCDTIELMGLKYSVFCAVANSVNLQENLVGLWTHPCVGSTKAQSFEENLISVRFNLEEII